MKIFVFGITPPQVELVQRAFPATVQVVGSSVFNANVKDVVKGCDFVVVSKFSPHKAYTLIKRVCGNERVSFASGGLGMIKATIQTYLDRIPAAV